MPNGYGVADGLNFYLGNPVASSSTPSADT